MAGDARALRAVSCLIDSLDDHDEPDRRIEQGGPSVQVELSGLGAPALAITVVELTGIVLVQDNQEPSGPLFVIGDHVIPCSTLAMTAKPRPPAAPQPVPTVPGERPGHRPGTQRV